MELWTPETDFSWTTVRIDQDPYLKGLLDVGGLLAMLAEVLCRVRKSHDKSLLVFSIDECERLVVGSPSWLYPHNPARDMLIGLTYVSLELVYSPDEVEGLLDISPRVMVLKSGAVFPVLYESKEDFVPGRDQLVIDLTGHYAESMELAH